MSILYKDIKDLPNGARFYPADLHLHSRGGSEDVKDPDMTVAGIVEQAYLDRIAILAITDHNTDKNTQESIDYAQKYVGELLVLAAVEVTTAHGHLLVYFSPDQTDALKRFLALLEIKGAGTPNSHTSKSMSDVLAEAMRLGGIGIAAHIDRPKTASKRSLTVTRIGRRTSSRRPASWASRSMTLLAWSGTLTTTSLLRRVPSERNFSLNAQ